MLAEGAGSSPISSALSEVKAERIALASRLLDESVLRKRAEKSADEMGSQLAALQARTLEDRQKASTLLADVYHQISLAALVGPQTLGPATCWPRASVWCTVGLCQGLSRLAEELASPTRAREDDWIEPCHCRCRRPASSSMWTLCARSLLSCSISQQRTTTLLGALLSGRDMCAFWIPLRATSMRYLPRSTAVRTLPRLCVRRSLHQELAAPSAR